MSLPAPEAGFVVDCSVSAAWLFEEQADRYTEAALDALAAAPALAPGSWTLEMLNVLSMLERRQRLSASDAVQALRLLRRLPVHLEASQAGPIELHALASRHQLTSYDAVYLDLALTRELPLATRDKALARAATDCGVGVWVPDPVQRAP